MNLIRNILLYILFAIAVGGCGGGNTTIASNNASSDSAAAPNSSSGSNATNTSGSSTTTSSGGSSSSGSSSGGATTTGTVTLQWSAPTTRADNTTISLSEISAYRLYYGPSATDTPNYINIPDGSATQYTMTLPSGTYYFRISAIDSSGYEGLKSTALQKTF